MIDQYSEIDKNLIEQSQTTNSANPWTIKRTFLY